MAIVGCFTLSAACYLLATLTLRQELERALALDAP
jgi:hypothetical protein